MNTGYALNASWVVPGGGNVNCGVAQPGVVGAPKIWFPATNAFRNCYFRKTFSISQLCEVKTAIIEIAAADNYLVFVNGVAIGSGNATANKFNIPVQLLQCENVIAVQARDLDAKCWWMSAKVTINSTPYVFTASSNSPATNPLCAGQTLNLSSTGLAGATYSWTGPSGFTSNQQNPTVSNVSAIDTGSYVVTVSVGKCCKYVARTYVNIKKCKDCLDFSLKEIVCKNGVYYLSLCVKNTSSHIANSINLISTTPGVTYSPNILNPPGGLLPGSTYCATVVVGGSGAISGAKICLKGMLVEIKDCKQSWFCTTDDDFCIILPDCVKPCQWAGMVKDSILTICRGGSVTLSAYTVPAVGATYLWTSAPGSLIVNGNTATPTVTPLVNPTIYTVYYIATNADGTLCRKSRNVIVSLKDCPNPCDSVSVNFNPNTVTICLGDSVQLNPIVTPAVGPTYLWIPSTGLSSATIKNPWAKPTVTTTYNLIVSYNVNGVTCKKDRSMTVVVQRCQPPNCEWKAMVKDSILTICKGTSTTLGAYTLPAIGGVSYNWTSSPASGIVNGNTANPTVTPTANPTTYTVTITQTSTTGIICKKTATVKVYSKDCPPIPCDSVKVGFVPNNVTICLGDSVQLSPIVTPSSGLTYLWTPSTGLSNATIKNPWAKPLVTTTYNLIVSVPNSNCKKEASITIKVIQCPPPKPCEWRAMVRDSGKYICRGASTVLSAYTIPAVSGATYTWTSSPASTIVNGNTANPTVTPLSSPTIYVVTISVPNSDGTVCTKTAVDTLFWKDCTTPIKTRVGVEENTDEITVAPNPTQSVISVQIPDSFNWKSATLINQQGIILNEQDRTDDAKSVKFDVQKQPSGMYIIRVKTDKGFVNKKVIKE